VTEVVAPAQIVAALLVAMSIHVAPPGEAVRWAALTVIFASLLPMGYVVYQVRRRRLTDHHVSVRRQRRLPMLVAIGCTAFCLGLLAVLGAPRQLVALAAAGVAGLLVTFAVTLAWKVSMHAATLAGAVTIVVIVFGPQWLPLVLLLLLVGWARIVTGEHTAIQVGAGAVIGSVIAASVYLLLR
jgi:membrane-associated phospholipid phosphatase